MGWVRGYLRRDGRYVQGHFRSNRGWGGGGWAQWGGGSARVPPELPSGPGGGAGGSKGGAGAAVGLILIMLFGATCLIGIIGNAATRYDPSPQYEDEAHAHGTQAGRDDGRRAGEAAGFTTAYREAYEKQYKAMLDHLYLRDQYWRNPHYQLAVGGGGLLIGFCFQWVVFYAARRAGVLLDIDRILLPKRLPNDDPNNPPTPFQLDPPPRLPPPLGTPLVVLFLLLPLLGCQAEKGADQNAWRRGYDANYQAAYGEARQEGTDRGRKAG
jgi:hypothetical protein